MVELKVVQNQGLIAIHTATGPFAAGWVEYCRDNNIPFKEVNCFSDDIIEQLHGCRALLWHWEHHEYRAVLFARQLIASVETMGIIVFPGLSTCWHYDDKLGQKYLLEAIDAPVIPSHVFYDKRSAFTWLETTVFPVVWKLRGGAGSQNVRLVRNFDEARRIVNRSFGRGWYPFRFHALRERLWQFRRRPNLRNFTDIGRGLFRAIIPHENNRNQTVERNYVYFQEFVPDRSFDIRVVVIGDRCYAFRRMTRDGDFRASGSGLMDHDPAAIPLSCVEAAFQVSQKLGAQSLAFDFVQIEDHTLIIEISYAFALKGYLGCPGYWRSDLTWHPGVVRPEYFMIEDVLTRLEGMGK